MSIEVALTALTDALNRHSAALDNHSSALSSQTTQAPEVPKVSLEKPAVAEKAVVKEVRKPAAEKPAVAEKAVAKEVRRPAANVEVSIEDAVATTTAFLGVDDMEERAKRKAWVVRLVASLGCAKVREITDSEDRAILVRYIEQATQATDKKGVSTLPALDDGHDSAEDDV